MRKIIRNKKGDIPSIIYSIIAIFIIGIIFLFANRLKDGVYDGFDNYFDESEEYNNSEAHTTLNDIAEVEQEIWDYAFLILVIGYFLALLFSAYETRISPIFYWIYGIISLAGLMLGVMLSNTWQEIAVNPAFSETIIHFPITNTLLGTYYPIFVTVVIVITMIFLFGKLPGGQSE